jgi:hypothetical protein
MTPPLQARSPKSFHLMRILSTTLAFLLRIATVLSLLLAALVILIAIETSSRPVEIERPEVNIHDGIQFDIARGRLWILSLRTRFAGAPPVTPRDSQYWTVKRIDRDWEKRLTLAQTGPVRFGFASHLRHAEHTQWVIDPATGRREDKTIVEDERITRVPLIAIIVALLVLPAIKLILRFVRRNRTTADRPSIIVTLFRTLLAAAAVISLCALTFILWNVVLLGRSSTYGWHTSWDDSAVRRSHRFIRFVSFTRSGLQLRHLDDNAGVPVSGVASHAFSVDTLRPYTSVPLRLAIESATSYAGFRYASNDASIRRFTAVPQRTTERALLIPQWAIFFALSVAPGAWLYLRLLPLLRRRHRQRNRLCQQCGYDLRGSSGRCPECGAPATRVDELPTNAQPL